MVEGGCLRSYLVSFNFTDHLIFCHSIPHSYSMMRKLKYVNEQNIDFYVDILEQSTSKKSVYGKTCVQNTNSEKKVWIYIICFSSITHTNTVTIGVDSCEVNWIAQGHIDMWTRGLHVDPRQSIFKIRLVLSIDQQLVKIQTFLPPHISFRDWFCKRRSFDSDHFISCSEE